jgi:Zn-dependent M28 family amino/carboxypeptidase
MIQAFANPTYDVRKSLPAVVLRHEDYGRIVRLMADRRPVALSFSIRNRNWPAGRTAYNVIAELPGSDLKDETVLLGAHLDSWHAATGATDDAIGCAVMMEAMRLLAALNLHPRRTIRIALWTGEEEGLYGSQAYVAEHFGTAEIPKPDFGNLVAYINIDGGTGRIRAANVFGPPGAAVQLRATLAAFTDIGIVGTVAHRSRRLGTTDATTFSRAGLTSIGLVQDPVEYGTVTEHSNLDTFEAIHEQDARDAATLVASLAFTLANGGAPLARFAPQDMPAPLGPAPDSHAAARAPNP